MALFTDTALTELGLLVLSFVLCGLIGIERQFRQKSSGFRTHVLVGMGAATFTLVSSYGFSNVINPEVVLDPSRIAAQVVIGIGFLGAGVISTRRDFVVGLTTAATIWVTAAVGMACGAGMVGLAIGLTVLHLVSLMLLAPLVRRIPTQDRRRVLRVRYDDGHGVLRRPLQTASDAGFTAAIQSSQRQSDRDGARTVTTSIRFQGRPPLASLVPVLHEVEGVRGIDFVEDSHDGSPD